MKDQYLKSKVEIEKEIASQNNTLKSLRPSLNAILKATLPLQEKMGLNIDSQKSQYEIANFLPRYLIFARIFCSHLCLLLLSFVLMNKSDLF